MLKVLFAWGFVHSLCHECVLIHKSKEHYVHPIKLYNHMWMVQIMLWKLIGVWQSKSAFKWPHSGCLNLVISLAETFKSSLPSHNLLLVSGADVRRCSCCWGRVPTQSLGQVCPPSQRTQDGPGTQTDGHHSLLPQANHSQRQVQWTRVTISHSLLPLYIKICTVTVGNL